MMDSFFSFFSKRSDQAPTRTSAELRPRTAFERLPLEMLLQIIESVDSSDVVCLTLCSHYLNHNLGNSSWKTVSNDRDCRERRSDFLRRLARDHEQYIFCASCCCLHIGSVINPPGPIPRYKRLLQCTTGSSHFELAAPIFCTHEYYSLYNLSFSHVQLVMLRHHHGAGYGLPLNALSITEVQEQQNSNIMTLLSVEPAVVEDELYMRVQQWILFPPGEASKIKEYKDLNICFHISGIRPGGMPNLIRCRLLHAKRPLQVCRTCEPLLRCTECGVEFQMTFKDLTDRGSAVLVSKWLSFGPGKSIADFQWNSKLKPFVESYVPISAVREVGSLSQRFEETCCKPLEQLTEENAKILRGQIVRKKFTTWGRRGPAITTWNHPFYSPPSRPWLPLFFTQLNPLSLFTRKAGQQ